ncbi:aldehyde dehydrogenase family protein [Cytobacillus sp. Hz8]|uniref:aldehyde dehydrogenase family protein n=1 Tax=Cytobacillus sp. Hz8 TaxID=3347168 RepID=UPI0035DD7ADE
MTIHILNYINGEWIPSQNGKTISITNPAHPNEIVGRVQASTASDVLAACDAAEKAAKSWGFLSPTVRAQFLQKAADILEVRKDEIAETATREMGKRFIETKGEVTRAVTILRYYAQEGFRKIGEVLPSAFQDHLLYSLRVPLGVVGIISPWNFPIAIPIWKIAPALIYGNTVVFKPATETGITGAKLVEVFDEAGVPEGVINFVTGKGSEIGHSLVGNPNVDAITFTGSNIVGKTIAQLAVETRKKYQLELGGKNPAIVLEDADLELAAKLVVEGAMKQTGQRCTATSRVYIQSSIYETFKQLVTDELKLFKVGDGLNQDITFGPVASKNQYETVLNYIRLGLEEGATLAYGGEEANQENQADGYFIKPCLFENVTNEMRIAKEEIFGPILCMIKVNSYEEALSQANKTNYGLSASLFTKDLKKSLDFVRNSEVGMVQINGETGGAEPQAPFGGMKESSSGTREQGQAAVEFFTAYKTVSINPN